MMVENSVQIRLNDSVVTITEAISKGDFVFFPGCSQPIQANQDIPIYHKIAITKINTGEYVYKYGEKIGIACVDIQVGDHVHTQNIFSVGHKL